MAPVGVNRRIEESIDSTLKTHSKWDSLNFNNEEMMSLKEVFCLFDKSREGYVNEEDLLRILEIMNRDNRKVEERMEEMKMDDEVWRTQAKFNFKQFLKIVGKIELTIEDFTIEKSREGEEYIISPGNIITTNLKQTSNDIQQSLHIEDKGVQEQEKKVKLNEIEKSDNIISNWGKEESKQEKMTPRLQPNIIVKRGGKVRSVGRKRTKYRSPDGTDSNFKINASNLNVFGIPSIQSDPPMNLMQFRGVRVKPDRKVLDILSILNDYRKNWEAKGKHLEAKKWRKRYSELKLREGNWE